MTLRRAFASALRLLCLAPAVALAGCSGGGGSACGPTSGVVEKVADGDTITLASGEKIRYLLVDTPESTNSQECYGDEAKEFNRSLVLGKTVDHQYDVECKDRFGRLLAYVFVDGREVNRLLLERGYACVLHIPPNGNEVVSEYESLEANAKAAGRGLWGFCSTKPC